MCGIGGYVNFDPKNKVVFTDLKNMENALLHRGPDQNGVFEKDKIGLMHTRLSILDLSSSANQPFISSTGRYVISFNGEIYNYQSLIKQFNLSVRTSSDTEVIVEMFERFGVESIRHFNGMFAFAIYDSVEKKLFLVRDRIGLKPLYYYKDDESLAFASEMKALLKIESIKRKLSLNEEAVYGFLHLGYVPEPHCIYKEIHKLPAGHILEINAQKTILTNYWKLDDCIHPQEENISFEGAKTKLNELLENAVKLRMISDVPLGVFLSGGIDSSLIAAIAKKHHVGKLDTFTVGYKGHDRNELQYARKVADYLNTDHHEIVIEEKEVIDKLDELIFQFDEPFADSSLFPTYFISNYAAKRVKTILAGEGADELFMGYGMYDWPARLKRMGMARSFVGNVLQWIPNNRYKKSALMFKHYSDKNLYSHVYSQDQGFFSEKELKSLIAVKQQKNITDTIISDIDSLNRVLSPMEAQAFYDLKYSLPGDLLSKIDRASMYCSLEVREPYLDYRLVEFAVNLPLEYKTGKTRKYILKEVLSDYIPSSFFDRPKQGFSIPLEQWLSDKLSYLIQDVLNKKAIEETNILNYSIVKELVTRFEKGEKYLYNRLWAMIVLQKWLLESRKS